MITRRVENFMYVISLVATACLVVAFLLWSLWRALRKRRLTIWELMIYVAGAGVAMAFPQCHYVQYEKYADMVRVAYHVKWTSLWLTLLALAPVVFLIRRSSRK
jgi:hypothetical protein